MISKNYKQFRQLVGRRGEDAAVKALEAQGFKILTRNYAVHNVGEIDVIAEKDHEIYIFEVRTRLNLGPYPDSVESVIHSKRNKVMRTAEYYVAEEQLYDRNLVFEVIRVTHDEQGNILGVEIVPF